MLDEDIRSFCYFARDCRGCHEVTARVGLFILPLHRIGLSLDHLGKFAGLGRLGVGLLRICLLEPGIEVGEGCLVVGEGTYLFLGDVGSHIII